MAALAPPAVVPVAALSGAPRLVAGLFALTSFIGSALLFLVQPLFARLVLPMLGGAPAVWNTAMLFFQTALLVGYGWAHLSTTRLPPRRQVFAQLALLVLPLLVLPLAVPIDWRPPSATSPVPALLTLMALTVGPPFLALSTMSPVLQRWFSRTSHPDAHNPYFLYAASNLGSMAALLSYPLWLEPQSSLAQQRVGWSWAYGGFLLLVVACALHAGTGRRMAATSGERRKGVATAPLAWPRRLRWLLLAFVPSTLMLGVTTYLSSEVAVVPLLWIIPLTLYLLTFVLAFARRQWIRLDLLRRTFPILIVALVVVLNGQATEPFGVLMLVHLVAFFVTAWLCHGLLAADRPPPTQLTEFYLWLSIGGVLGGVFNALLAPLWFSGIAEYPIALSIAALVALWPWPAVGRRLLWRDVLLPLALGISAAALVLAAKQVASDETQLLFAVVFGGPALIAYFFSRHALRFGLAIAALFAAGLLSDGGKGRLLHRERSFFGVHRVAVDDARRQHLLIHGRTLHGIQNLDHETRDEPLAYYHRTGPVGDVLRAYAQDPAQRIGVVGLGAGAVAAYAQPAQPWTFFEIDPIVVELARDERYFTFLARSAGDLRIVLGDARLSLAEEHAPFDVLLLDAFSSDAIPVHLVTREAVELYVEKMQADGVMVFHISNLHVDLEPVLGNLARALGLACLLRDDTGITPEEHEAGKSPSVWLAMANQADTLTPLRRRGWRPARMDSTQPLWTDDYSSLLRVFKWH